ncbi:MAG: enoyl-CoA hydratase/isomerase family protein, partial [Acidimicrobiales bacterium]
MPDDVIVSAAGGVARVTINRPERRNALSWEAVGGLRAALGHAKADPAVRVIVLTGAGDRAFCAGADLSVIAGALDRPDVIGDHHRRSQLAQLFLDLWDLGKPTIARVRGHALAAGFGLALACDFVVAADDAQFGTPEIDVGIWPFLVTVPMLRSMPPR